MGKCFSDAVEQALQYIYYDEGGGKGKEGFQILEQASAAGDGDASCVLARCLCGHQYVWEGHRFPVDDNRATALLHKAVEQGSAMAVLVCLRTGDLTPSLEKKMPFSSVREAFEIVLKNAELGDAFSQYVIGNSYFWWDFIRIQQIDRNDFKNEQAFRQCLKENIQKSEDWFWKAFRGGIHFAGNNLRHYYLNGDEDIIEPQPAKAADLARIGAERGYPGYQCEYARELRNNKQYEEALHWFKKAAAGGDRDAWYFIGEAYEEGKLVGQDLPYAAQCYEKGLNAFEMSAPCHNGLADLYWKGKGVPQDYAKAYQLLSWAYEHGNNWGVPYMGMCCFYGQGTQQDYGKARKFLEEVDWNDSETFYLLGCIYGRGLGVNTDIKKGVAYLQRAGNHAEAKKELLCYKKTLFGKWVRR